MHTASSPSRFHPNPMPESTPNSTKKLSVILDEKLHNQAKRYAVINDMTLTQLVVSLLEERLNQEHPYPEERRNSASL